MSVDLYVMTELLADRISREEFVIKEKSKKEVETAVRLSTAERTNKLTTIICEKPYSEFIRDRPRRERTIFALEGKTKSREREKARIKRTKVEKGEKFMRVCTLNSSFLLTPFILFFSFFLLSFVLRLVKKEGEEEKKTDFKHFFKPFLSSLFCVFFLPLSLSLFLFK